ncbi:alpha/beta hydrolase [Hyphomonas sp. NPDC076900]|uniref:alpha/beta hydrolase n=1 Tax=unclassified Hyphomonas TaxID=2630699 RepID=UPI003CFDD8E7
MPSPQSLAILFAPILLLLLSCASRETGARAAPALHPVTRDYTDPTNNRLIPTVLFGTGAGDPKPLAILAHGYGNLGTDYSFLTGELVSMGYVVAAPQFDLPDDPPLARDGDIVAGRMPAWERGASGILQVAQALRQEGVASETPILLVGHSNGGDIAMLLVKRHPEAAAAVFTLDNRRMALPRTALTRVCSLRSSDFPAEPGVLPTAAEQTEFNMLIRKADNLRHDEMWDGANAAQKAMMIGTLRDCLDR